MPAPPSDFMKLPAVIGKAYDKETVTLDGTSYQQCLFNQCKLVYHGGPTRVFECSISSNCTIEFQDSAAFVLQTLVELGWKIGSPPWM